MATSYGPWVIRNGNLFRLGMDQPSTNVLVVYGQSQLANDWTYPLVKSGGWSGSPDVTFKSSNGVTVTKELHRATISASGTYSVSLNIAWAGLTATCSRSVTVGSKPGAPSGFSITRTSTTTATLAFTKGSGATSTQLTASKNGATYYELAEPTGSSQAVTGLAVDSQWRFAAYSKNAAGKSDTVGPFLLYTTPKAPTKPVLSAERKVDWALPARYKMGVQLQRSDNAGSTVTAHDLGAVTTWTDPAAQQPTTQYRVRCWAGPSLDEARTYSDWSEWSAPAFEVTYVPPQISSLTVERCLSTGVLSPTGTYLRVVSSGTVQSVKNAANAETNKLTRRVRWRQVGASTWGAWTTFVNQAAPTAWTDHAATVGAGGIQPTQAYELEYEALDNYSSTVQQVLVATARVALSLGETEVGIGKVRERGTLDVGGDAYIEGDLHVAGNLIESDPNQVVIDGVAYPGSGIISRSVATTTSSPPGYVGNTTLTMPFTPPAGWFFHVVYMNTNSNAGYTAWLGYVTGAATASVTCRIIGNISSTSSGFFIWKLTKLP